MRYLLAVIVLLMLSTSAAFADTYPVAGATSGIWLDGGTNVWTYAKGLLGNSSDVEFDGASFNHATPYNDVYLGQIELNNGVLLDPTHTYTNTLNFEVHFTTPNGNLSFLFPLRVNAKLLGNDVLLDLPSGGSQSLIVSGEEYTLSLDGFFKCPYQDLPGNKTTQITSPFGTTIVAKLYGDFSTVHVPEPGSLALLGTFLAGVWGLCRKVMNP